MPNSARDHHFIQTNGITLHAVTAGPADGPPVVLLHGFPEFWYGWRKQIPALAAAGFRVWAPDQRGYNLSDKPKGIAAYELEALAHDIIGFIEATGHEQVNLVGHDWGGMVAWCVALLAPQMLRRVAILNAPHPHVARQRLSAADLRQLVRSGYIGFFQLSHLPEAILGAAGYRTIARALRASSRPGTFPDEELAEYRRAWSQPGAMTAMLNWYRALRRQTDRQWPTRVTVPLTVIWGKKDQALRSVMAEESVALCDQGELIWLPDNTHWVQHEAAEEVNALLIERFTLPL